DFGVAKTTMCSQEQTETGMIKGKLAYVSPEQLRGDTLDRRVDVFSLGIVLYRMTTGRHPFRAGSDATTIFNISSDKPPETPSHLLPNYPKELEAIVLKALGKNPDTRYTTCGELGRALRALPEHLNATSDTEVSQYLSEVLLNERKNQRER